jgi:hypothetical protein
MSVSHPKNKFTELIDHRTPILIIGFNRPELLQNVLKNFSDGSRTIYISIDGPRNDKEKFLTDACKKIAYAFKKFSIQNRVHVKACGYNQGCKKAVTSAINWAFQSEEELIILEDDIVISQSFLNFCDIGLSYFRMNKSVFQLSGWTPLIEEINPPNVYLTKFAHIWGWATWKDRWKLFDENLENWDNSPPSKLPIFQGSKLTKNFDKFWVKNLLQVRSSSTDIWDTQWLFSMWKNQSYSVSPGSSLCKNIGFDDRATHTRYLPDQMFEYQLKSYLKEPPEAMLDWKILFGNIDVSFEWDFYHEKIAFNMDFYGLNLISDSSRRKVSSILTFLRIKKYFKKFYAWFLKQSYNN